jgi:hypothetical protein
MAYNDGLHQIGWWWSLHVSSSVLTCVVIYVGELASLKRGKSCKILLLSLSFCSLQDTQQQHTQLRMLQLGAVCCTLSRTLRVIVLGCSQRGPCHADSGLTTSDPCRLFEDHPSGICKFALMLQEVFGKRVLVVPGNNSVTFRYVSIQNTNHWLVCV